MKKAVLYIFAVVLIVYVAMSYVWTANYVSASECKNMYINIYTSDSVDFVTRKFIIEELKRLKIDPRGKKIQKIDIKEIEDKLGKLGYVEDAQCYTVGHDAIMIGINPIKPVLRVFEKGKSYYMNKEGKLIPSDERFFIDLPVVSGNFSNKFPPTRLLPMVDYIEETPVLRNLVTMIEVRDSNNIFVVPNIAYHVVNMGTADGYVSKFKKLLRMYREVLPVKGWDAYDTISVKWDNQIVATKRRGGSRLNLADYDPPEDEEGPDIGTMTIKPNAAAATEENASEKSLGQKSGEKKTSNSTKKKNNTGGR